MSLLLFEHIHGESRDRGQAMVDLMEAYRKSGFTLATKELPDYLPLLLEYLAQRPQPEGADWLRHASHIVALLGARAAERQTSYAVLCPDILVEIGCGWADPRRVASAPARSPGTIPEAMDRLWEKKPCASATKRPARTAHHPRKRPRPTPDRCSDDSSLRFRIYPYIAMAVFFIGSWVRFDYAMYTWRTGSSQLLSNRGMRLGSNLFHIGILAIFVGHFVGLLTPHSVYEHVITSSQKQVLAMVAGGIAGALCFVGIAILCGGACSILACVPRAPSAISSCSCSFSRSSCWVW